MLEKPDGVIHNVQSRSTGNTGHKTQNEDKQKNKKTQHRKMINVDSKNRGDTGAHDR